MAQNIFPLFERNRIMKKELLWALRDYSYGFMRLEYEKYADGIIEGLDITVNKTEIQIGRGIVKYKDNIILFEKSEIVPYQPTGQYVSLKLKMSSENLSTDYILNSATPFLDEDLIRKENEFELCRFKLKAGSRLRNDYVGLFDIETEFDTVNLAEATWSAIGNTSICPVITRYFAQAAIQCNLENIRDIVFTQMVLNSTKALARETIEEYVRTRLELEERNFTNRQLFNHLELILRNIQNGTEIRPARNVKKKRQIIVD